MDHLKKERNCKAFFTALVAMAEDYTSPPNFGPKA
jgi:hypothetical protein